MKPKRIKNSELFHEAWKIYKDCVRKWEDCDLTTYPEGWKYGIPNSENPDSYLYSNCPGKLFMEFKDLFYKNCGIAKFRNFLLWLEKKEGKTA